MEREDDRTNLFKVWKITCQYRFLYPAKMSVKTELKYRHFYTNENRENSIPLDKHYKKCKRKLVIHSAEGKKS